MKKLAGEVVFSLVVATVWMLLLVWMVDVALQ
jgi:hypothetical protein